METWTKVRWQRTLWLWLSHLCQCWFQTQKIRLTLQLYWMDGSGRIGQTNHWDSKRVLWRCQWVFQCLRDIIDKEYKKRSFPFQSKGKVLIETGFRRSLTSVSADHMKVVTKSFVSMMMAMPSPLTMCVKPWSTCLARPKLMSWPLD